jgi:hypothetical protein
MANVWDYCPHTVSLDELCTKYGVGAANPSERVLMSQGARSTVAALFTDWDKGSYLFQESDGDHNHAEALLLKSEKWLIEIPAHLKKLGDSGVVKPVEIGIVINRSPCRGKGHDHPDPDQRGCSFKLASGLRDLLAKAPKGVEVTARLAMLGAYEGKAGPTSYQNLDGLIKAGWTLNALGLPSGMPTANGQLLRSAIMESHDRVRRQRAAGR